MALFRLSAEPEGFPTLRRAGLTLRPPRIEDYEAWARLRHESRAFLEPWEPAWPADDLTRDAFRRRLRRYAEEIRKDSAYPFLIFAGDGGPLLGGVTLGQVRRGVALAGTLGYWIGAAHARRGHMAGAVRALLDFSFGPLGLRRIEAACLPENRASIGLLEAANFRREGLAREYLCIAGAWRDHVLFATLRSDQP